jgi:integrase
VSPALASKLITQGKKNKDGRVFVGKQGGLLRRSKFRTAWDKAVKAVGLEGMTPHGTRHSLATWLCADPTSR